MDVATLREQLAHLVDGCTGTVSVAIETDRDSIRLNADAPLPSASLIKVPIMLEAYRQARNGTLHLSQKYTVPPHLRVGGTGVISRLSEDASYTLQDLIALMIMVSDNAATNILIELVGMDSVNRLAAELNCRQTVLGRKMMDFEAARNGRDNYTSAADMIAFLREITSGQLLADDEKNAAYQTMLNQQFRGKLPAYLSGDLPLEPLLAHKTGELPGTEHDAGILSVAGSHAYIAVLTTGLADNATGRHLIAQIGKLVYNHLCTVSMRP